jgi:hypothetical protein
LRVLAALAAVFGAAACGGRGALPAVGSVQMTQTCVASGAAQSCSATASAAFGSQACRTWDAGACTVTDCRAADGGSLALPEDSAGTVTIAGSLLGDVALLFDVSYPLASADGQAWNPGDMLTASATGGSVPAFSGETVAAPADIAIEPPLCTSGQCGHISRSADMSIAWTGPVANVSVSVNSTSTGFGGDVTLTCVFSSSPATVPAAALANLPADSDGFTSSLSVGATNSKTFAAGNYAVTFSLSAIGSNGSSSSSGAVVIE